VAASSVDLRAEVRVGTPPVEWPVEVRVAGRPALLVDAATDALDQDSLDRLELRAARVWRRVTRNAPLFEPRPWLGAIRVVDGRAPNALGVEQLVQLVASRTLDAACVVVVDRSTRTVRNLTPVTSIESFHAALVGRCLVLTTGIAAAR